MKLVLTGVIAVCLASPAWGDDTVTAENGDNGDPGITVTATRMPIAVNDAPVTVTVIDADRIADELATDIGDLVRYEPGVTVRRAPARFGAALGTTGRAGNEGFAIRGIGGNRVIVQVDGVRVPDGFTFGAQASGRGDYVDIGLVKSVEILRGPGSGLYGSDGLSGVVSFITSDPEDIVAPGETIGGLVRAQYASADDEFAETAILAGIAGDISMLAAYTRRDFHELANRGSNDVTGAARTTPNPQDGRSDALLGKIVWQPAPDHAIRLTGEYLDTRLTTDLLSGLGRGRFGPAVVDALSADDTGQRTRATLDWTWNNSAAGGVVEYARLAAYWQDGEDRQFTAEDRTGAADRTRLNTFENRVYGAAAELRSSFATASMGHALAYGAEVSFTRQQGLRDGTIPPTGETFPTRAFPVTDYTRGGVYLGDTIAVGGDGAAGGARLTLYPALRFDFYDLDPQDDPLLPGYAGAAQSGSHVSPKFGAVVKLGSGVSAFGNFARGFKAPEPGQVNQFFENLSFGYTSLPNPDLGPETSESWEGGLRFSGGGLSTGLVYFRGDYDDFISQQVVGGSFTSSDPARFQFVNYDRVRIKGLEARARFDSSSGFHANLAAAWADGDIIDPSGNRTPLDTIDPFTLVVGAGWRDPGGRFGGQIAATYHARKDGDDTTGLCATDCFRPASATIIDVTGHFRLTDAITLRGGIFNITDQTYALWSDVRGLDATSTVTDAYTRPGRNASISASFRF